MPNFYTVKGSELGKFLKERDRLKKEEKAKKEREAPQESEAAGPECPLISPTIATKK